MVAASNPALLACTRSPRARAACMQTTAGHACPRSLLVCPATASHPGSLLTHLFYSGRPLSLGTHRHLRHHPRYGASRRSSTGLHGPVAAGAPACPRPRPSLCTPACLVAACGAHVARYARPPMPKTPQDLSPLPVCAYPRRRSAQRTSSGRGHGVGPHRLPAPPLRPGDRRPHRGSASVPCPG